MTAAPRKRSALTGGAAGCVPDGDGRRCSLCGKMNRAGDSRVYAAQPPLQNSADPDRHHRNFQ